MNHFSHILIVLLVGTSSGFGLGWWAHSHYSDDDSQTVVAHAARNNLHAAPVLTHNNQELTEAKKGAPISIAQLLQQQRMDELTSYWVSAHLTQQEKGLIQQQVHQHLNRLAQHQDWLLLEKWLRTLEGAGLSDRYQLQLLAKVQLEAQQYTAALETLYAAQSSASEMQAQRKIQTNIEDLLDSLIKGYQGGGLSLSVQEMLSLLEFAKDQSPDYIPISLALAEIYSQQHQYDSALDALAFLPFNEQYNGVVEERQSHIQSLRDQTLRAAEAIPLIRVGNQFLVNANIVAPTHNETEAILLLLDTGATFTSINKPVIQRILTQSSVLHNDQRTVTVRTANGRAPARVFKAPVLKMGHAEQPDMTILEIDMGVNSQADGLLGMEFLGQYQFEIDQENALLYLSPL